MQEFNQEIVQVKADSLERVLAFLEQLADDADKIPGLTKDMFIVRMNVLREALGLPTLPLSGTSRPTVSTAEFHAKFGGDSMGDGVERVFNLTRYQRAKVTDDHYSLTISSKDQGAEKGMWRSTGVGFSLNGLRCLSAFLPSALEALHPAEVQLTDQRLRDIHASIATLGRKHPSVQEDAARILDTLYIGGQRV